MCSDIRRLNKNAILLFLPKSLHSEPRNQWIEDVFAPGNYDKLMAIKAMTERLKALEEIGCHIKGIGKKTIDATLAYFENQLADIERNKRKVIKTK